MTEYNNFTASSYSKEVVSSLFWNYNMVYNMSLQYGLGKLFVLAKKNLKNWLPRLALAMHVNMHVSTIKSNKYYYGYYHISFFLKLVLILNI